MLLTMGMEVVVVLQNWGEDLGSFRLLQIHLRLRFDLSRFLVRASVVGPP